MKYILVTGGVISGLGKGVIASSIGTLLKACGLRVTSIKIDPYINIDAGTFSPYEHGEISLYIIEFNTNSYYIKVTNSKFHLFIELYFDVLILYFIFQVKYMCLTMEQK